MNYRLGKFTTEGGDNTRIKELRTQTRVMINDEIFKQLKNVPWHDDVYYLFSILCLA